MSKRAIRTSTTTRRARRARRGFTLLETALATVIIAVGVLALIEAQATFTRNNNWSTSAATGAYLANEIRERMRVLPRHDPVTGLYLTNAVGGGSTLYGWGAEAGELTVQDYNDLDDFDGRTFGAGGTAPGPIDSTGAVIAEVGPDGLPIAGANDQVISLRGWSQQVIVEKVDPQNFNTVRSHEYTRPPAGSFLGLGVDQFPLRVTVIVRYTMPGETQSSEMARMVWIAP